MYKHFLTDKVLRDPRQRRFFKAKDLTDLFTLGDEYAGGWPTARLGWRGAAGSQAGACRCGFVHAAGSCKVVGGLMCDQPRARLAGWLHAHPRHSLPRPPADGTETASLFATLGTDVLPDEEPEGEAGAGAAAEAEDGEERHASDRDDYSSGREASPQQAQQQQGTRRPGSRSSSRSRRSASADRGGSADLPASAGVRSEAVAPDEEGGEAASGKGDAKILRELFEGSGVRGAIDHTKVEGELRSGGGWVAGWSVWLRGGCILPRVDACMTGCIAAREAMQLAGVHQPAICTPPCTLQAPTTRSGVLLSRRQPASPSERQRRCASPAWPASRHQ